MSHRVLTGSKPWPVIKKRVDSTPRQVLVAIAYIGDKASDLLRLKKGDVLVCNASELAIKQGSTSASALATYIRRGVKIYSQPTLHGKVVVLSRRAFIGSANASSRSEKTLREAVIESTDPAVVRAARLFVVGLATSFARLDKNEIRRLSKLKVTRLPPDTSEPLPPLGIPGQVDRLWLMPMSRGSYSKKTDEVIEKEKTHVRQLSRNDGIAAGIEGLEFTNYGLRGVKIGDWIVQVFKSGRLLKPTQVLKVSYVTKNLRVLWLAIPKVGTKSVWDKGELIDCDFDWENSTRVLLANKSTKRILKMFKAKKV